MSVDGYRRQRRPRRAPQIAKVNLAMFRDARDDAVERACAGDRAEAGTSSMIA
jgi:hypothetical protein